MFLVKEGNSHTCACMYIYIHVCPHTCHASNTRTHRHMQTYAHTDTHIRCFMPPSNVISTLIECPLFLCLRSLYSQQHVKVCFHFYLVHLCLHQLLAKLRYILHVCLQLLKQWQGFLERCKQMGQPPVKYNVMY